MADSRHITRRTAIVGLAATAVAAASVSSAAVETVEQNISVGPQRVPHIDLQAWLETAPASVVAEYHLTQLTMTLRKMKPGHWVGRFQANGEGATVARHPELAGDTAWISWELPS